jgi:hypothetical protein
MKKLICLALLTASPAFAQGAKGEKVQTEAERMEGALNPTPEKPALDVSKMPFGPVSVKRVVEHNLDQVQACYESTLAGRDKTVEGKLNTQWVITTEGLVKDAKIVREGTTLKDGKLHECVLGVISAMTFPVPKDKREHPIKYPFNLKAEK